MSRLERWLVYPALLLLGWTVFGRDAGIDLRAAVAGEPAAKVVEAQQFRLVDGAGVEVGSLSGPTAPGRPWGLDLGREGEPGAARLRVGEGSASLMLMGPRQIQLQVHPDGTQFLLFYDKAGTPRLGLTSAPDGAAALTLGDANGKRRVRIDTDAGPAVLTFTREDGEVLWQAPPK